MASHKLSVSLHLLKPVICNVEKGRKHLAASHSREWWLRIVVHRRHWFSFAVTTGL